jgi:hypothetical protein
MSLANNQIITKAITFASKILTTINEITDRISGGDGLLKSLISLGTLLGGLKLGGLLFNKGLKLIFGFDTKGAKISAEEAENDLRQGGEDVK